MDIQVVTLTTSRPGYWTTNMQSANPSSKVSDNLNHRYYGYMRDLLSTEHSYPSTERVKELYEGGLKSWKESGYNPYYVYWPLNEDLTGQGMLPGVTNRYGSTTIKQVKLHLDL